MLSAAFEWLDAHPAFYWWLAVPASLLLVGHIALVLVASARGEENRSRGRVLDPLCLLLFLLAWRWPFLLSAEEYNPDESQFIAGAITLAQDPVFFRSVDGTTSGPLNFYALLPFHWLGLPLDYFTARVAALLLNWAYLFLALRALAQRFGRGPAWLGVAPAIAMTGTAWQGEFVHYSSELVSVFLLTAAAWCLLTRGTGGRLRLRAAALLAGLAPWAKLQSVPLSAVLILWAIADSWREETTRPGRRWRDVGEILLAAAVPTLVTALLLAVFGQVDSAWRRYVLQNLVYVEQGRTFAEAMRLMFGFSLRDYRMPLFLGLAGSLTLALSGGLVARRLRSPALWLGPTALLAAAVFAVVAPRREMLHYTIYLVVPLSLVLGLVVGAWWGALGTGRARAVFAAAVFSTGTLPLLATRFLQPVPEMFGQFATHWRHPRSGTGEIIRALSGGHGALGVWGWAQRLYVEAAMPQATRDALTPFALWPNPQQNYYRESFVADMRATRPAVFVDVVGTDGYIFQDRAREGHEVVPALAAEIRDHYTLVYDTSACRIYVRNDLPAAQGASQLDLGAFAGRGRESGAVPAPAASSAPPEWRKLGDHRVLMLHPPAAVEWPLPDHARQISLGFGVDPVAYREGTTNGVELVAEIVRADESFMIFRRRLRPREVVADRGLQAAEVTLPPLRPGSRLVLSSDPGDHGDAAWDWLYLSRVGIRTSSRFLPQQFPGYNRVPESVDAPRANLLGAGADRELVLHAPATLRFRLAGSDRSLRFLFGISRGAYEDGGQTDGAEFRVTLHPAGGPPRILYSRLLRPLETPADRGDQTATVSLAEAAPGDLLELTLDCGPAGNGAWDWTYLRQVHFQ